MPPNGRLLCRATGQPDHQAASGGDSAAVCLPDQRRNPGSQSGRLGGGPKYVVKRGKTPVLSPVEARQLLDSIESNTLIGLRDRALIGLMVYSFARVGATVTMKGGDLFQHRKQLWLRLHEQGGKRHEVPCHAELEAYVTAWTKAAGISRDKKEPLFRSVGKGRLSENAMPRFDVFHMIKRRAKAAGLPYSTCCHTFRATGSPPILKMADARACQTIC
jgi:integrase